VRVALGSVLALAVLAAGMWRVEVHYERGRRRARWPRRLEDSNNLRQIAGLAAASANLPMRDGAFDPYDFVKKGEIAGTNISVLRSQRSGVGPTEEEARADDYTNFPWERYRGERRPWDAPPFPLLRDKKPDEDGIVLVAFSDGSVQQWDPKKLERALAEAGIGR